MGLSEQFASLLKTSSCESRYLLEFSSPLPWGLQALAQQQPSGKGEGTIWAPLCGRVSWGTNALVNQVLTWVWSGRTIGIKAQA